MFEDFYSSPIPIVEEDKKKVPYKITPIGGPLEIQRWREMQAAKESVYRMRLNARSERIIEAEKTLGTLDHPKVSTQTWADKQLFAASERERLALADDQVTEHPPWIPIPQPKQTIPQKIIGFFKQLWIDSNF